MAFLSRWSEEVQANMKKTISILILITCLLLSLTACGGDPTPSGNTPGTSDTPSGSDAPSSEAPTEKVDPDAPITEEMLRNHPVAPAEDFSYDVTENGVKISAYNGKDTVVVIPEEIEGKTVVEFYDLVFANSSPVRAVVVPKGVKKLANFCANSTTMEIVICEGTEEIAFMTFSNCETLREVHLGSAANNIHQDAFLWSDNLTIYAPAGSYAETFAKENNIPFQAE